MGRGGVTTEVVIPTRVNIAFHAAFNLSVLLNDAVFFAGVIVFFISVS